MLIKKACRCGVIGRRSGLKIRRSKIRTGSSPVSGISYIAEWSSLVARWAHNPKVVGSNPSSAIKNTEVFNFGIFLCFRIRNVKGKI